MKIILGSSSPRRKELLSIICENFIQISPDTDETILNEESPINYAKRISIDKLNTLVSEIKNKYDLRNYLIITSDTIVTIENNILGKPKNYDNAFDMLNSLNNKEHKVITSLTMQFYKNNKKKIITDFLTTKVKFKNLSKNEIENYLNKTDYHDKAGSYAIQENGELIIEQTTGSISNIVGFPMRLFLKICNNNNLTSFF